MHTDIKTILGALEDNFRNIIVCENNWDCVLYSCSTRKNHIQGQGQGLFIRHILNYTGYNQK